MKSGNTRKCPPPQNQPSSTNPPKYQATSREEELIYSRRCLSRRNFHHGRRGISHPPRPQREAEPHLLPREVGSSASWNSVFQQFEIDHVIGESHKELMSNSSGPAAIIRIFGVTKAVVQFVRGNHFLHNIAKLSCCRPPSYCGFKYKNATFWEIPKSGLAAPDSNCTTWRNYEERRPGESIF